MSIEETQIRSGAARSADESVGTLLSRLGDDVGGLVKTEVGLAKAELEESISDAKTGVASLGIGAVVLFVGLLVLLLGVSLWLAAMMGASPFVGYLIVGGVITVIGAILLLTAKSKLSADNLAMNRTTTSLKKDQRAVKENLS